MPLTEEQLNNYGDLVCSVRTLNTFLSSVKCNSDGTFTITSDSSCCYNGQNVSIDHLLQLMTIDAVSGMGDSISSIEFPEPESCCDTIKEIYGLLGKFYEVVSNGFDEVSQYLVGMEKYFQIFEEYLSNIAEIIKKICEFFEEFINEFKGFIDLFKEYYERFFDFAQKFDQMFESDFHLVISDIDEKLETIIDTPKVVSFIPYNVVRGDLCIQRMALLYDNGEIRTVTGNLISNSFIQRRMGYCCCP